MGENPFLLAESAKYLEDFGVKIIDLNLGCPSRKVTKKGCGAAMLLDLELLKKVVSSIRKNISVTFSAKMRAGWDDSEKTIKIAKILENEGIDFLTLHPRTKMQKYDGRADWNLIKEVKEKLEIPLIANGDIFTPENAKNILKLTKADGIMMGRGVLQNPFLINQIIEFFETGKYRNYSSEEYKKFYQEYTEFLLESGKAEKGVIAKLKEHFSHFLGKNSPELWNKVKRGQSLDEILNW
jgi:nifR3 family TIM-barrel protein